MSRNDLRLRASELEDAVGRRDHAANPAEARRVDVGIAPIRKQVAGVNQVVRLEMGDQVAVGVRGRNSGELNDFGADVDLKIVGRERRQRDRRRRWRRHLEHFGILLGRQPLSRSGSREDRCTCLAELLIAAGVVEVPVRVDQPRDRLAADGLYGVEDLLGAHRHARVDDRNPVCPIEHGDIPARTANEVQVGRELDRLDGDLRHRRPDLREQRRGIRVIRGIICARQVCCEDRSGNSGSCLHPFTSVHHGKSLPQTPV